MMLSQYWGDIEVKSKWNASYNANTVIDMVIKKVKYSQVGLIIRKWIFYGIIFFIVETSGRNLVPVYASTMFSQHWDIYLVPSIVVVPKFSCCPKYVPRKQCYLGVPVFIHSRVISIPIAISYKTVLVFLSVHPYLIFPIHLLPSPCILPDFLPFFLWLHLSYLSCCHRTTTLFYDPGFENEFIEFFFTEASLIEKKVRLLGLKSWEH